MSAPEHDAIANTDSLARILLVEDDHELAALIARYLAGRQFAVSIESNGAAAVSRIIAEQPDLLILDLMLPGLDGISICRELRPVFHQPILMLTASNDEVDQIVSLEIGADDYLAKPVEPRLLLARIRALLRRSETSRPAALPSARDPRDGPLEINPERRLVSLHGETVPLSSSEFDLLSYLVKNAGQIVDRETLFREVRNIDYDGQSRFFDILLSRLRRKLGPFGEAHLRTVRGHGYLFDPM